MRVEYIYIVRDMQMILIEIIGDKFRWLYPSIFGKLKDSFLASVLFFGGGICGLLLLMMRLGGRVGKEVKYIVTIYSKRDIFNEIKFFKHYKPKPKMIHQEHFY